MVVVQCLLICLGMLLMCGNSYVRLLQLVIDVLASRVVTLQRWFPTVQKRADATA